MNRSVVVLLIGLIIIAGLLLLRDTETFECLDADGKAYECSSDEYQSLQRQEREEETVTDTRRPIEDEIEQANEERLKAQREWEESKRQEQESQQAQSQPQEESDSSANTPPPKKPKSIDDCYKLHKDDQNKMTACIKEASSFQ